MSNTVMTGNQNILIEDSELAKASDSIFGKGFLIHIEWILYIHYVFEHISS